jgi:uncharacterized protein (TIGR00369 family)
MPTVQDLIAEVRARFDSNHFSTFLGLELLSADSGRILLSLPVKEQHMQNVGFVHGGILATMADVAMGFAAVSVTDPSNHILTGELKISYLNPGIGPILFVEGFSIKAGKKLVFTESEIYRSTESGTRILVAKASATMVVVSKKDVGQ